MKLTLQQAVYYLILLLAYLLKTSLADTPRLPPKNEREATATIMANVTSGAVIGMEGMKWNGGPLGGGYGCKGRCSSGALSLGDGAWVGLLWVMVVDMVVFGGRDVLRLWV
jgi:hypothetical protein